MPRSPQPFLANMLSVVLASTWLVMTTAFISIPLNLGGHPGEVATTAAKTAFHPT